MYRTFFWFNKTVEEWNNSRQQRRQFPDKGIWVDWLVFFVHHRWHNCDGQKQLKKSTIIAIATKKILMNERINSHLQVFIQIPSYQMSCQTKSEYLLKLWCQVHCQTESAWVRNQSNEQMHKQTPTTSIYPFYRFWFVRSRNSDVNSTTKVRMSQNTITGGSKLWLIEFFLITAIYTEPPRCN